MSRNFNLFNNAIKLPEGWRQVRLGEVCQINPRRPLNLIRNDDVLTSFVPMAAVDEQLGIIANPEEKPFKNISKGYTFFAENDVLFAKITPCMQNGKHAIARNLIDGIGFGSTEFHVLHPSDQTIPEWIHFYIRQPIVLRNAMSHFTGAVGQQRVPEYFLANISISLPPLPEQKRIAAILNEQMEAVEKARAAAETQCEAAKALPAAYLREVFHGNEAQRWPIMKFEEIAYLQRGHDLPAHQQVPGDYPIMTSSGRAGTHIEYRAKGPGVVTGRSGSVGKVHYVEEDFWPHNTALFVKDFRCNEPRFIFYLLKWIGLKGVSSGSGVLTLDRKQVHKLQVRCPVVSEQKRIAAILDEQMTEAEKLKKSVEDQLDTIKSLPASLLRQAFCGNL